MRIKSAFAVLVVLGLCVYGVAATCKVQNCQTCSDQSTCTECTQNYTLSTNTCTCSPTFTSINNTCQCPAQTTYVNKSTCVTCDIQYCTSCKADQVCSQCQSGFVVNGTGCSCTDGSFVVVNGTCVCPSLTTLYKDTCVACKVSGCTLCNATNQCSKCAQNYVIAIINNSSICDCPTGYQINSLGNCISCSITNCASCQIANTCAACQQNYLPNSLGQYCSWNSVPDCQYSVMGNVCTQCQNASLTINSQNTKCIFCNVSNCAICQQENLCYLCQLGYEFAVDQVGYVCVMCGSIQGCLGCYRNMTCARCQTGYVLSNDSQSCILCPYPCATCNPGTTTCLTCLYPYSQTPTPSSICYTCQTPNCLACNYQNPSICLNCTTGYNLTLNSTACSYLCQDSCARCNDTGSCLECFPGYVVSKDGTCLQCLDGRACWKCYEGNLTCFNCSQGFYLTTDHKCLPCPLYCAICNQNSCLTYKIASGQAAYNTGGRNVAAQCSPACLSCFPTNPSACRQCQPGYYLNQNICTSCPSFCKTCLPSLTCLTCVYNAVLINGSCTQCNTSSNCQTCNPQNTTQCLTCPPTFSLSNSTCSIQCPQYCQQCQNSICTVCQQGYSPNLQGICLPCMANCSFCSGQVYGLCLRCSDGYFFNQSVCVACGQGCLECTAGGCVVCYGGFVLNSNFTCTAICAAPCATCSGGATLCTSCLAGYSLQGSFCQPKAICIEGCNICPLGYSFSTTTTSDCKSCTNSLCAICNNQTCVGCYNGYYLDSITKFCLACKTGCSTCNDPTTCLTCSPGYTSLQPLTFPAITCTPCQYPCITCFPTPTSCTNCLQGYYLQGGLCISSFNFGFTVTLNTTSANFYANYASFLGGIVAAGVQGGGMFSLANITMMGVGGSQVELGQGRRLLAGSSLVVQGIISTTAVSGSTQAGNQYYNISQALSNNSVIGSMTIINSAVSVSGGTVPPEPTPTPIPPKPVPPQPETNNNHLALILGITIPVCLIIIIGVSVFVYKKKKQREAFLENLNPTSTPQSPQSPQSPQKRRSEIEPESPNITVEARATKNVRQPTQDIQLEVSERGRFSHV